jgi:hypothetical protein
MSLSICPSCPSEVRSRCSSFNLPLHKAKKDEKPILSEHEKACILLKHIYVCEGHEEVFYEGGRLELGIEKEGEINGTEQSRNHVDS